MNLSEILPYLIGLVPLLSLAAIGASMRAPRLAHRYVFGVLGWLGWLTTVGLMMFIAVVIIMFADWGSGAAFSPGEITLLLGGGAIAVALPGAVAYAFRKPMVPVDPTVPTR